MSVKKINRDKILVPALDALIRPKSPWAKTAEQRASMTIDSKDAEIIPRVPDAGETKTVKGKKVQVMHNGLYVKKDGYQGKWQSRIIESLKGVHEPQEEAVFYEVVKRLKPGAAIIELGSWWSYYSMWVLKDVPDSKAICCEPDPANLELGKANVALNGFKVGKQAIFYHSAAGSQDGKVITFENIDGTKSKVPIRTVDAIVEEQKISRVGILHMDIQGVELEALKGAQNSIKQGKVRFVFVSTHHYSISGDPLLHHKCLEFIKKNGGHIIARHTVNESSSGDGLIVASFFPQDKDFKINVNLQPTDDSLFRSTEYDLDILWRYHNILVGYAKDLEEEVIRLNNLLRGKKGRIETLEKEMNEINTINKHIKRQVALLLKRARGKRAG